MTLNDIHDEIVTLRAAILESCELYPATELGLDHRCGSLYVAEDYVVTEHTRNLDYYGGFEYITPEYRTPIGDLTIYSSEHGRVQEALSHLEHSHD